MMKAANLCHRCGNVKPIRDCQMDLRDLLPRAIRVGEYHFIAGSH